MPHRSPAHDLAYNHEYRRLRGMLLGDGVICAHCRERQATTLDHDPPLAMHVHRPGSSCCRLIPSCWECNRRLGQQVADGTWRPGASPLPEELPPERTGLEPGDRRWKVPWLRSLRAVPADATWPRLMTVPHPAATGSLGAEFARWVERRSGVRLRWWQLLVAARLLETDDAGRLVWETLVLTMARQLGKSWLLRELILWRIHQGDRFGEPQDVLHTGKDLGVCKEVQRPARLWAKARADVFKVREVNGQEEIELLGDGSRWIIRAKEAVYGYGVSVGAVDEAWKVKASAVEEGLTPTMAEREQPQLLLLSTAHRMATALMLGYRSAALAELEAPDGDLLIEWSAPADAALDDRAGWRAASPHWTPHRERLVEKQLARAQAGETEDPDEPDPIESFKAQWLNLWPRRRAEPAGPTEPLLGDGIWAALEESVEPSLLPVFVALEDDFGRGAAVAAVARLDDGRLEVDGWTVGDWDSAVADLERLRGLRTVRQLVVGGSLMDRLPRGVKAKPGLSGATRAGLALFRDLALTGQLVHDRTPELDLALADALVRESPSGLHLVARGAPHLIRATVWALQVAHRPARVAAIR